MKTKKLLLLIIGTILLPGAAMAQVYNSVHLNIEQGCFMKIDGVLNNNAGSILNSGTIILSGDYTNDGVFTSGGNSTFKMDGAVQNLNGSNVTTFNDLVIDGTGDKQLFVDARIAGNIDFANNNVVLGNNDLVLLPAATVTNAGNTKFFITDGTGTLVKNSMPSSANFLFPVGTAANNFKPVQINNSGVSDTFAVRVMPGLNPPTSANNACVQYTWEITESNAGGSNANVKVGWNTADEGSMYIRAQGLFWHFMGGLWTTSPGAPGAVSNLPLTDWRQQTTITDFSSAANRFILSSGTLVGLQENEPENAGTVSIYPNPSGGLTTLDAPYTVKQLLIMDIGGKVVAAYDNINNLQFVFRADDLDNGMYIYMITGTDGQRSTGKFMVSR